MPLFTVVFSRLHAELKAYWTGNDLNNGIYPDDVELQMGSRIKLRAHELATLASGTHTRPWMATQGSRTLDKHRLF